MYGFVALVLSILLGTVLAVGPVGPLPSPMDDFITEWYTEIGGDSQAGLNDQVITFDVSDNNLTSVTVHLTWSDDELLNPIGRRDDTLTLRVEGPPGVDVDDVVSGTSGDLELQFDLANVPTDPEAGNIGNYMDQNATGEWSITISVAPQGLRDTGNAWSVSISYTYYLGRLIDNPEVV
jgi:hypothetical protein